MCRNRSTFSFRAASRTTWVPRTSVRTKSPASITDRSTWVSAAKWTTASAPRIASDTRTGSQTSPRRNAICPASRRSRRFSRFPAYVSLSSTTTSRPFFTAMRTKFEPMNPAPPVTRRRTARDILAPYIRARRQALPSNAKTLSRSPAIGSALRDLLVIGGSGLLGQYLVQEAATRGYRAHGNYSSDPIPQFLKLELGDSEQIREVGCGLK